MRRANLWLLALVVLAALSLWLGRRSPGTGDAPEPPPAAGAAAPATPEAPVHLVVLNGTDVRGLASRMSLVLASAGCVVERLGDAPHPHFERTLLINRRLPGRRAEALAGRLGGVPVLREWDPRASEDALLVLGADHERVFAHLLGEDAAAAP